MDADDYVAKLNTYIQRHDLKHHYEDAGTEGPDHIKKFAIKAVVNGKAYLEGVGKKKKEAKQKAAKHALQGLLKETESASDSSVGLVHSHDDHVSWLHSYGKKINMQITCHESTKGTTFQCRFLVGKIEYPDATGTTKKEAEEEAAKLAYLKINASVTGPLHSQKAPTVLLFNLVVSKVLILWCQNVKNTSIPAFFSIVSAGY
ncbi:interferon-induced, double-stranded RNA-activated protein kinase-like, partial [Nerophis lumbriciformis]|uniref:interferon-induced, double-stranded RNA-activated protein kinase-like n=1 Tax=Nerophis lumbriciformis TaxID=546530 RepID=UPI003BAC3AC2